MVSAKLISTVISLTAEEKRRHLYSVRSNPFRFSSTNRKSYYPKLVELFQSIQSNKTINLRIDRDKETDEIIRNQLRRQALQN
jgi:hypothetical protein